MKLNELPRIEQIKADLAASAADSEAGRIVPGETVLARIQAALDRYTAEHDDSPAAIRR